MSKWLTLNGNMFLVMYFSKEQYKTSFTQSIIFKKSIKYFDILAYVILLPKKGYFVTEKALPEKVFKYFLFKNCYV